MVLPALVALVYGLPAPPSLAAGDRPIVTWNPKSASVTVARGGTSTLTTQFTAAKALRNVSIVVTKWPVPRRVVFSSLTEASLFVTVRVSP